MLTLILLQFLQFIVVFLLQFSSVIGDCGFPGRSVGVTLSAEKLRYDEHEQIVIKCGPVTGTFTSNKLIVFHDNDTVSYSQPGGFYDFYHTISMRQKCSNGSWVGGQPRCAHSITNDIAMKRILVYDDSNQQKIIDLDHNTNKAKVLTSQILERVTATTCQTCNNLGQTCMTSTSKYSQKWKFSFQTKQMIPLIVLTIRYDPKLEVDQIAVKIKEKRNIEENEGIEIRTCKIFNVKREFVMRPSFINFINEFGANFTYSPNSYPDNHPLIELTFICPVKRDILQEEQDPGHGVSWRAQSIANYMEVYFRSQSAFDRPITMCSWEFMRFPEKCGEPDVPLHSRNVSLVESFRVDYECVSNYMLTKNNEGRIGWTDLEKLYNQYSRRCGVDGDWFDESVSCRPNISCPLPQNIKYLKISYKNQTYFNSTLVAIPGTIATFSCIPDYGKKGSWENVCGENGSWTDQHPFCSDSLEQSAKVSLQEIIIISLVAVLIIGGLLVGVAFFVVFKRLKRRQQTDSSDVNYDDINDQKTNEDYDAYYEPVNYENIDSSDLDKRYKTVSYLSLNGSISMNDTKANYHNVTHDNNNEYLQILN